MSQDAIVLRADRWVDVDAGEVRSPRRDRRRGHAHRGGEPRRSCPSARPRSTSATSRCCPASWTWRSTCSSAGRTPAGYPRRDVAGRPGVPDPARDGERPHDAARGLHDRAQPRAVREDRRLPARRRARPGRRQRLDRRPAHHPGGPRDHTDGRPPRPDDVPAARARTSCRSRVEEGIANGVPEVREAVRYQIKYGARSSRCRRPVA